MATSPDWWNEAFRKSVTERVTEVVQDDLWSYLDGLAESSRVCRQSDANDSEFSTPRYLVLDAWVFGSLVHGCANENSDVDTLVIVKGPEFRETVKFETEVHGRDVDVNCQHERAFRASVRRHLLTSVFCLFTPKEFTLVRTGDYSDIVASMETLSKPRLRRAALQEGGHSLAKARRLFQSGDRLKGAKNVVHGLRFLRISEQLVKGVAHIDWACANKDQATILAHVPRHTSCGSDNSRVDVDDFAQLEKEYRPQISSLMSAVEHKLCNPVDPPLLASAANVSGKLGPGGLLAPLWLRHGGPQSLLRELSIEVVCSDSGDFLQVERGFSPPTHAVVQEAWHGLCCFAAQSHDSSEEGGSLMVAWPGRRYYDAVGGEAGTLKGVDWRNDEICYVKDGLLVTMFFQAGRWLLCDRRGDGSNPLFDTGEHQMCREDGAVFHATAARELLRLGMDRDGASPGLVEEDHHLLDSLARVSVAALFWQSFDRAGCKLPSTTSELTRVSFTFKMFGGLAGCIRPKLDGVQPLEQVSEMVKIELCGAHQLENPEQASPREELDSYARILNCNLSTLLSPSQIAARADALELAQRLDPFQFSGLCVFSGGRRLFIPCPSNQALKNIIRGNGPRWGDEAVRLQRLVLEVVRSTFFCTGRYELITSAFPELAHLFAHARRVMTNYASEILEAYQSTESRQDFFSHARTFRFSDFLFRLKQGKIEATVDGVLQEMSSRPLSSLQKQLQERWEGNVNDANAIGHEVDPPT